MTISNPKQQNGTILRSSSRGRSGFIYFLVGGGIGATTALLFAPKSGADLRTQISDLTRKGYDETLELAQLLKEQSADIYHSLKEKTDKVYDLAAVRFSLTKDVINDSPKSAAQKINGEIRDPENYQDQKHSGGGRRASNIV